MTVAKRDHNQLRAVLRNVHVYAVTPFSSDDLLRVDLDDLQTNLDFLVSSGVKVVGIGGGTGEVEALSDAELISLAEAALEAVGDRLLVMPCLPENLARSIGLLRAYERLGVQVALTIPPLVRWKVPPDLEGVIDYYRLLSRGTDLYFAPYNTQRWPVEVFERLAGIDNVIAVKDPCESPYDLYRAIKRLGERMVWIGNKLHDPGVLHLRYQMGIEGFTSGQGNFLPGPELEMHEAAQVQDWQRMIKLQELVAPLASMRAAHDDAAMVKAAMDLVGLKGGRVRPPRQDVPHGDLGTLEKVLSDVSASLVHAS